LKILYIYKTFPVLEYHTLEIFLALMNRQTKLPQQMQKLQTQIYLQFYSYRIKKCLVFFFSLKLCMNLCRQSNTHYTHSQGKASNWILNQSIKIVYAHQFSGSYITELHMTGNQREKSEAVV